MLKFSSSQVVARKLETGGGMILEFSVPKQVLDRVVAEYSGNIFEEELEEVQCLLQEINNPSQETGNDTE